jgi:hypothetical protein
MTRANGKAQAKRICRAQQADNDCYYAPENAIGVRETDSDGDITMYYIFDDGSVLENQPSSDDPEELTDTTVWTPEEVADSAYLSDEVKEAASKFADENVPEGWEINERFSDDTITILTEVPKDAVCGVCGALWISGKCSRGFFNHKEWK